MTLTWDGRLDAHHAAHAPPVTNYADYELRLQVSNVSHAWQGAVGNSGPAVGPNILRSLEMPTSISIVGDIGVLTLGYDEGETSTKLFLMDDPHAWTDIGHTDITGGFTAAVFDGDTAFF